MKKVILSTLLFSFLLIFSSCGSDDDPEPSIIGTWKQTNFFVDGESHFDPSDCSQQTTLYFNQDNTWKVIFYDNDPSGTGCLEDGDSEYGIYEIEGNSITFSGDSLATTHETFTVSALHLEITYVVYGNTFVETYLRVN